MTKTSKLMFMLVISLIALFGAMTLSLSFNINNEAKVFADSTIYTITYSDIDDVDTITQFDGTNETAVSTIVQTQYTADSGKVYLYNVTKEGYNFDSWWYGTLSEVTTYDVAPSGTRYYYINSSLKQNIIVKPEYSAIQYTITYHNMEGAENPNPAVYTIETDLQFRNASKNGYTFLGWYLDEDFTHRVTSIDAGTTGNYVVYAKFELKDFVISYMYGDYEDVTLKFGDEITDEMLPTPERKGYIFEGWYTTKGYVNQVKAGDIINRDLSLFAKWSKVENPLWKWFTFGGMGVVTILVCVWFIVFNKTKSGLD